MRLNPWLTLLSALLLVGVLLAGAWAVLRPSGPALTRAAFSFGTLTPNADGDMDVTIITYALNRPATVSIYFVNEAGERFYFRREREREGGEHRVEFSGIVEAYRLPGDTFEGELLTRVLQDGAYEWVIEARDEAGAASTQTGSLTIAAADTVLPELLNFTASPPVFSPNQDGINDRILINVYLTKAVNEGGLRVTLIDADGTELNIPEQTGAIKHGERGLHAFDYDGGIDLGQEPPPDGEYVVRAEVEDRLGQRLMVANALTIVNGGLPRAEIYKGEVVWSSETLLIGETLYFTLTVENYSEAPIRTSGPMPGYVYPSMDANYNFAGERVQSGAWRVGLMCENCLNDYPWRWALGSPDTLTAIEENGETYYYLAPGQSATITGGVVLDQIIENRNPQYFWAGLIHEDVEIAGINNRVDPQLTKVEAP